MSRKIHVCLDIIGALSNDRRALKATGKSELMYFNDANGRQMPDDDVFRELLKELSEGHLKLPMGACDNFDYQDGCQGHEEESAGEMKGLSDE